MFGDNEEEREHAEEHAKSGFTSGFSFYRFQWTSFRNKNKNPEATNSMSGWPARPPEEQRAWYTELRIFNRERRIQHLEVEETEDRGLRFNPFRFRW